MTPSVATAVDGRDPTRVVTRRCFALLVDALLLALIPLATVAIVGNAKIRKGVLLFAEGRRRQQTGLRLDRSNHCAEQRGRSIRDSETFPRHMEVRRQR